MIVLWPLEFVNLLSKDAVEAMYFVCFLNVFRPSGSVLDKSFNVIFFTEVRKIYQKHFGLHTHNECCTIAVLFFVFGEVMLSIKAAISPSLCVVCSGHFLVQVMILSFSGTRMHKWLYLSLRKVVTELKADRNFIFTLKESCVCFWLRALRQRV